MVHWSGFQVFTIWAFTFWVRTAWAEEPGDLIAIAKFREDKAAAISFTFDDGSQNQVDIAIPILNEFGFKATFFVVSGLTRDRKTDPLLPRASRSGNGGVSWEEWRVVARQGHEIGNHSMSHATLTLLSDDKLKREVDGSARRIAKKLGRPPLTLAYPYNIFDARVRRLVLKHHIAEREFFLDYGVKGFSTDTANGFVDAAIRDKSWIVPMLHGIEEGYQPLDRKLLRAHFHYIRRQESKLWVDTFANVSRYLQERARAQISVKSQSPGEVIFTVDSPLDRKRYDIPLTVMINSGKRRIHHAAAVRDGRSLQVKVKSSSVLVDVTPGMAPIRVMWD